MNQEKIYEIERRVAELKFLERDLLKEREIGRIKCLDRAEKSDIIAGVIKNYLITPARIERKDLIINSFPSKFSGRDDDEFMCEVKVELIYKPSGCNKDFNELILSVYLVNGFHDEEVQMLEKRIMDKLIDIRKAVDELKESKKDLKHFN